MRLFPRLFACLVFALCLPHLPSLRGSVVINEFVASNRAGLADEDGLRADWIELRNTGTTTVDLGGWSLSDDPATPRRWSFASGVTLAPGGHLLVWASGKDRPGQTNPARSPEAITGLVAWLRADTLTLSAGQAVATWPDSSGRGNHATQPTAAQRPTFTPAAINGLPALTLNRAASQQVLLPTAAFNGMSDLSNFTFLAVARWTGGVRSGLFGGYRGANTANLGSTVFEITSDTGALRLRIPNSIDATASPAVTSGQWHLLGAAMDATASRAGLFRDGTTLSEPIGAGGTSLLANFERLPVGSSFDDARTFGGQIAEVMIYNRALSALERDALGRHLAAKYALSIATGSAELPPHTNFSLSAAGETLLLTRPDGTLADQVDPVALPDDVAYGRLAGEPTRFAQLQTATPGAANSATERVEPPAPVAFSHASGRYGQAFSLTLTHPDPRAVIVYTLDGSAPALDRLAGAPYRYLSSYNSGPFVDLSTTSLTYTSPLAIADRSAAPNRISRIPSTSDASPTYLPANPVKKATVVRARAYIDGVPGPATAATYFVSATGAFDYPAPIASLFFDEKDFFDYEQGIYVAGVDHVLSIGGRICNWGNFNRTGDLAESPGIFQFFDGGLLAHERAVGFRINGNCSRRNAYKSLRLHSGTAYDPRGEIDHPFFTQSVPDAVVPGVTAHRRLILRTPSINEVAFCRLYQPVFGGVGGRLRPVVTFFNGEYWGVSHLRERLDQHYLAKHYDLDPENLAVVDIQYGFEADSSDQRVFALDAGLPSDLADFHAMRTYISNTDMSVAANYAQARTLLDIDSYIDHLILKIFAGDDHYAPEYIFWRARSPQDTGFGDGRWRVMVKDFDSTLFTANYVAGLATGTHPRPFGFELFRSLLANTDFRRAFIGRFSDLLNTHFLPARFQSIINAAYDEMAPMWPEMSTRWNNVAFSNPSRPFTTSGRASLLTWSTDHPARQRTHLRQHFGLGADVALTVNVPQPTRGRVRVNTVEIAGTTAGLAAQPYPWSGLYFQNLPVRLTALPSPGYRFAAWRLAGATSNLATTTELSLPMGTATSVEALFEPLAEIHRWDFEAASTLLVPTLSAVPGATLAYTLGSLTEVLHNTAGQDFTTGHLRINNPLGAALVWSLPTTGLSDLSLAWLTRRSGQGAGTQIVDYTTDGSTWLPLSTYAVADAAPQLRSFDLSALPGVTNNPRFAVRVTFAQGAGGTAGNHRFDQVTLSGVPLSAGAAPTTLAFDAPAAFASSGTVLAPIMVRLFDAAGLPALSFNGPVTIGLDRSDGTLLGTATVNAINGVATFSDLAVQGAGVFRLIASASSLPAVTSSAFRVVRLEGLIVPRYIQGGQDTLAENTQRVPFAWLGRIEGLAPGATYRYANRIVLPTDTATSDGSGNMIFPTGEFADWIRATDTPRFQAADLGTRHHTFTAGTDGTHVAWFVTEPTGNARFTPGNTLHPRLLLNDGASGETVAHVLTSTTGAAVLRFGATASEATAIHGSAPSPGRRIAVLHDDTAGANRPLAATPVERTGAPVDERYAAFYRDSVAGRASRWGTLLPNTLPTGLRRVEFRSAFDASAPLAGLRIAASGFAGTVNPTGGLTTPVAVNLDTGLPLFLPTANGTWQTAANWSPAAVPNAVGASARFSAPAAADRNVNFTAAATAGYLRFDQAATPYRNRLRALDDAGSGALVLNGGAAPALIQVEGAGGIGHVDLDFINPTALATDLVLLVNQIDGDPEHGALRLQGAWTGSGGLIKHGPGIATLSGVGKTFTGPLRIEQGVLRITAPASPSATSGVVVRPGGQLRLVSSGTAEAPAAHVFGGGPLRLAGSGRGADIPESEQLGVLGALRYDPASGSGHVSLANAITLDAPADIHVDGPGNRLRLDGALSGAAHSITKTGGGTLELAGLSATVSAPSLHVLNGMLGITGHHPAAVELAVDGVISGSGHVGPLAGPGTVALSTTRLTAPSAAVGRIAVALTTPGGLLGNGALVLTGSATPLPSAPSTIDLFLADAATLRPGDRFAGGVLTPSGFDLATALAATQVRLYLPDATGLVLHLGQTYRAALPADQLSWRVADYAEGRTLEVLRGGTASTYDQWRSLVFPDAAVRLDNAIAGPLATRDGLSNLARYAFGAGPTDPAATLTPTVTAAADGRLAFRFKFDPALTDLIWRVESSTDLLAWSAVVFDSRLHAAPARDATGWAEILVPRDGPRRFLRLRIDQQ